MASKTQQLYDALKSDILGGKFPANQPVRQKQIAEQYQVSRIPVRDVLLQLKSEGWLAEHGKCGLMPSPLDDTEAEDLYLMRMHLEPLILELAMPCLTQQQLGKAADILSQLEQPGLSITQYGRLNWAFHLTLYSAAQRPTLLTTLQDLHNRCGRYIGFHSLKLDYADTSQDEHFALLELIRQNDQDAALTLLRDHIHKAGKIICEHIRGC